MSKNLYQPLIQKEDGTCDFPEEFHSFVAFRRVRDLKAWMKRQGYNPDDYTIRKYKDGDIENASVIEDDIGNFEGGGCLNGYNFELEYERLHNALDKAIEDAIKTLGSPIKLSSPFYLYEDEDDLSYEGPNNTGGCPQIVKVDKDYAYGFDGNKYPLRNINDFDDIENLHDAVVMSLPRK